MDRADAAVRHTGAAPCGAAAQPGVTAGAATHESRRRRPAHSDTDVIGCLPRTSDRHDGATPRIHTRVRRAAAAEEDDHAFAS